MASAEHWWHRGFVLQAVRQRGTDLRKATRFQGDQEIVLEAVRRNGTALQFASEALRSHRDIALAAIRHNGQALQFVDEVLQADRQFVLEAVRRHGWALTHAASCLKADREVVLEAVRRSGWAIKDAAPALRADAEVVIEAIRQDEAAIQAAAQDLQHWSDELLLAGESSIAVAGSQAPVFTVHEVHLKPDGCIAVIATNMAGDTLDDDVLPSHATLGDLARRLAEWHGRSRLVYMDFPGRGLPGPCDHNVAIVDFAAACNPHVEKVDREALGMCAACRA